MTLNVAKDTGNGMAKPVRSESFLLMSGSVLLLSANAKSKFMKPFHDNAKRGLAKYS